MAPTTRSVPASAITARKATKLNRAKPANGTASGSNGSLVMARLPEIAPRSQPTPIHRQHNAPCRCCGTAVMRALSWAGGMKGVAPGWRAHHNAMIRSFRGLFIISPEQSAPYDEHDVQHEASSGGREADLGDERQAIPCRDVERLNHLKHVGHGSLSSQQLENPAQWPKPRRGSQHLSPSKTGRFLRCQL